MIDQPKVSMVGHPVLFTRNKANTCCSRLACVPISFAYSAINKTDHVLFLWQNMRANNAGSRLTLLDAIMGFLTLNQPRVDFSV